jgi:Pericentrin-AKAP-450 domain of centrosomal targeting protein
MLSSNQADLRMIQEMGVKAKRSSYESQLALRQRFRATVYAVVAANRIQRLEREWRRMRKMGEGLRRARGEVEAGRKK